MRIRLLSVSAPVDFVLVDRSAIGEVVVTCREGMAMCDLLQVIRKGLTVAERDALRAQYGWPPVAEMPDITELLPSLVKAA